MKFVIFQKTGTQTTKCHPSSGIASINWDIRRYFGPVVVADDFGQALARAKTLYPTVSGLGVVIA